LRACANCYKYDIIILIDIYSGYGKRKVKQRGGAEKGYGKGGANIGQNFLNNA